jgi:hypothetical protein
MSLIGPPSDPIVFISADCAFLGALLVSEALLAGLR